MAKVKLTKVRRWIASELQKGNVVTLERGQYRIDGTIISGASLQYLIDKGIIRHTEGGEMGYFRITDLGRSIKTD